MILMWPDEKDHTILKLSCTVLIGASIFVFYGEFMYILKHVNEFDKLFYGLFMLVVPVLTISKLPVVAYKCKELKHLLDMISANFWPSDMLDKTNNNSFNGLYKAGYVFMIIMFTTGQIFTIVIIVQPVFFSERTLPFPCVLPVDWSNTYMYIPIYIIHVIVMQLAVCLGVIGTDYLLLAICIYTANQYYLLQRCFLVFNTSEMKEVNQELTILSKDSMEQYSNCLEKEYLLRCVKHHTMLVRFTKDFNKTFNPLEIGQLINSVWGVCLGTFILSRDDVSIYQTAAAIIYSSGFVMQLGIDCVMGNEMWYQASLIPDCLFQSNWKSLEKEEIKKDVLFILQNTQRFPQFTAYGLYDMNMTSFIKVLKVAFSAYTFLTNVSNTQKK
ncbi:odorant receptor 94a-like [Diabrotica virgifera virgifera]|uniref:Odorant receptor n=1 Tax=Diabrotica virgifera virgifera TaxID=50390 RepID=A0A6P7FBR9_DIAVI|nr:odorant receptor 94a-like [Diabrotica virgifera virgifera]